MTSTPALHLERFSYAYPETQDWVLRRISLEIRPGQCHCITGPTGCGKTTLLMAIRGLLPQGRREGSLFLTDGSTSAGIVMQNPSVQLLGVHLGAEVAFGLENHCVPPGLMPARVRKALARVGLGRPLAMPVASLSMGQQYRACLAGTLVMEPALVLLDEPVAQLDPNGLGRLMAAVARLKRDGKAVLICDHRPEALMPVIDATWRMDRAGGLASSGPEAAFLNIRRLDDDHAGSGNAFPLSPGLPWKEEPCDSGNPGHADCPTVIRVREIVLHRFESAAGQAPLSFDVRRGERVAICGPNGSGKTTLVKCLAGLDQPCSGSIEVFGRSPDPVDLRGRMGVLFQNPRNQLFETTVFDEVAFAARRRLGSRPAAAERVHRLLKLLDLESLAKVSPHALSYGQKHLVGLAAVAAGEPELLILDDPLAGLDNHKIQKAMALLTHLNAQAGTTLLWTSHHDDLPDGWAHRTIRLASNADDRASGQAATQAAGDAGRILLPMAAGTALITAVLLSMAAFAARSALLLAVLTGINLLLLFLRCPRPAQVLRRSVKLFIWQCAIIVVLYGLRFGWHAGAMSGLRVAWQLMLAFLPGIILTASTSSAGITRALSRVLPHQTAFVAATCLRFLPMLLLEMENIRQAQVFRGARLLGNDLKAPRYWPDWIHCLLVPTLVRTLALSSDISLAAAARDFGRHKQRTYWPGDA